LKNIEVVAAIILFKDKVLCVQRPRNKYSYISEKFEFPGGKIEIGETKKEALARELVEELNISPKIEELFLSVIHEYPDFEITMHSFICRVSSLEVTLNEHISMKWLTISQLKMLDWAEADIPIVKRLMQHE